MNFMIRVSFSALLLLSCSACVSHIDPGQVDYRMADSPDRQLEAGQLRSLGALERRYFPTNSGQRPFEKEDVYAINLEQVVIGQRILEGSFSGTEFGYSTFGDDAEIAILAHVFEFSGEGEQSPAGFDYSPISGTDGAPTDGSSSSGQLKLVYYSESIEPQQAFNLSNIPISPREKYNGGTIGIRLVVMEIDTGTGPLSSLMQQLAQEGRNLANDYSPSTTRVLFELGQSLFSGGQNDDILLDYVMTLNMPQSALEIGPTFRPGHYVLRRQQNRQTPMDWSKLFFDHNTGRVMQKNTASRNVDSGISGGTTDPTYVEVRDGLMLTVNIQRYPKNTQTESFALQSWDLFRQQAQQLAESNANEHSLDFLVGQYREALLTSQSERMAREVLAHWRDAKLALESYEFNAIDQNDLDNLAREGCQFDPLRIGQLRDSARRDARDALREMLNAFRIASNVTIGPEDDESGTKPFDSVSEDVVSEIARFFMPWPAQETPANRSTEERPTEAMTAEDKSPEDNFVDAQAFTDAYANANNSSALFQIAETTAKERSEQRFGGDMISCARMIEEGIIPASAVPQSS
ncbi:hypothetical protein [Alteraurantiacibacter aquimixticola]|uniref:Uncharacterized protein n=1 Tax=Alteraurantiacibacter aquimixticola TaxID=2489173 RepID=A0A4T3F4V1_9SPHN|nr:hypothetical protein [Alteraurantiacibacter aquimixticola]TIX49743.1 hypothetical protein E5222_13090 [Alteraurantiacibacter aquimixticola]